MQEIFVFERARLLNQQSKEDREKAHVTASYRRAKPKPPLSRE